MVYLSFNQTVTSIEEIADTEGEPSDSTAQLPLQSTWVIWEQLMGTGGKALQYSESTKQIASCDTVESFWDSWSRLPQPSELLNNRMVFPVSDGFHVVDALMIFREGISPQWEDEANADGGHFQFHIKAASVLGQVDEYWNNLVLGMIGASIEPANLITGVRLVDKIGGRVGNFRIEVWFRNFKDQAAVQQLQQNVERCMATRTLEGRIGASPPRAEVKNHNMTRHQ
eukprot:TRINITY_DN51616_c0_g1_i1.p1 TRINITY_DN51616_c0_g1~~TRINITY_DN51616_c0_g1_i1.p1  ORF type:complete len:247 (-),score=47.81 TRINITY_DN51616_c0_g1_i1:20-700(-)